MHFLPSPYIKYTGNAFYYKTTTLLSSLCWQFEAKKRASAEDALRHSYFRSLGEQVQTLADSEYTQFNMLNRRVYKHCLTTLVLFSAGSIFSIKGIQLQKDLGKRSSVYPESGKSSKEEKHFCSGGKGRTSRILSGNTE